MNYPSRHGVLLLGILVLGLAALPAMADSCSSRNQAGNWAYTYSGTIFTTSGALPLASVGHFRQDAAGHLHGTQTRSVAGSSGLEDISGTIAVSRDCSATGTINVLVGGQLQRTAVLAVVYDQDGNHVREIFESLTLPDGTNLPVVITIDGNRVTTQQQ